MATALAKGIADSKLRAPADICGSDRVRTLCRIRRASRIKLTATTHRAAQSPEMRAKFANAVGKRCFVTESNVELAKKSNVIFLSVKPSIVPVRARCRSLYIDANGISSLSTHNTDCSSRNQGRGDVR